MARRFIQGLVVAFVVVLGPVLGNPDAIRYPQLWLLILVGIIANVFQPSYKVFDRNAPREDQGTALQNLWTCVLVQLAAIIEAVYFRYPESFSWDAVVLLSFVIMLSGLALRTWAVFTLGKFFTWHVTVQPGQRIIRTGPYRFIRHPSYTGAIMTYLSGTIFLHAWTSALMALMLLPLSFVRRIKLEEKTLKSHLGKEYELYMKDVSGLIPGVW
jgi:protein-S-isoprenylcysteine O-methyltransferase